MIWVNFHRWQALMREREAPTECHLSVILFHYPMSVMFLQQKLLNEKFPTVLLLRANEPEALENFKSQKERQL